MGKVPFNVDAYTARLIGRENVATLNGAILELVKNTYDADATICIIYFDEINETLYLMDNGVGMTKEIIVKNWMTIGRSTKKKNFTTQAGRVQTGAKGIGRFALDRIADRCEMLTISDEEKLLWKIDWSIFDFETNITEITADLDSTNISARQFLSEVNNFSVKSFMIEHLKSTGTIFKLSNLRENWTKNRVKKTRENLRTLIPIEISNIFKIYVFDTDNSISEAEVLVEQNAFDFDYKINFESDNQSIRIEIFRNEFDFNDKIDEIIKEGKFTELDKEYFLGKTIQKTIQINDLVVGSNIDVIQRLGNFNGTFYFIKRNSNKKDIEKYYYKNKSYRSDNTFLGIKVYRDGFRVRPYGESGSANYDWLLLDNRKQKSPAAPSHEKGNWRVSAEQIFGSLFISRTNLHLPDQANREGIVETEEFILLREILKNIISNFEKDRQYVFRKLNAYYNQTHEVMRIEREIKKKAEEEKKRKKEKQEDVNDNIKENTSSEKKENDNDQNSIYVSAFEAELVIEAKDEEIEDLKQQNRMLTALATTGIVANTYIHEFRTQTHELNMNIMVANQSIQDKKIEVGSKFLQVANEIRKKFTSWFSLSIESVRIDKRYLQEISFTDKVRGLVNAWNIVLKNKNIVISLDTTSDNDTFNCYPCEIENLFNNLITNSVSFFNDNNIIEKQIQIDIEYNSSEIIIEYYDNGVGLTGDFKKNPYRILEQDTTDRKDENGELIGTGMGMWLVNCIVNSYNGNINLDKNCELNNGFWAKITLKR